MIILETILASALAIAQPQTPWQYYRAGIEITSNCPAFDEVKKSLPNYGIENLVAQAPYQISLRKDLITISWNFFVLAYSMASEYKKILILKDDKEVNQLIQREDINVIEIYESNASGKPLRSPSATIFKGINSGNGKTTYVKFDLSQDSDSFCENKDDKSLVHNAAKYIAAKRLAGVIEEKRDVMPIIPERVENEI